MQSTERVNKTPKCQTRQIQWKSVFLQRANFLNKDFPRTQYEYNPKQADIE